MVASKVDMCLYGASIYLHCDAYAIMLFQRPSRLKAVAEALGSAGDSLATMCLAADQVNFHALRYMLPAPLFAQVVGAAGALAALAAAAGARQVCSSSQCPCRALQPGSMGCPQQEGPCTTTTMPEAGVDNTSGCARPLLVPGRPGLSEAPAPLSPALTASSTPVAGCGP